MDSRLFGRSDSCHHESPPPPFVGHPHCYNHFYGPCFGAMGSGHVHGNLKRDARIAGQLHERQFINPANLFRNSCLWRRTYSRKIAHRRTDKFWNRWSYRRYHFCLVHTPFKKNAKRRGRIEHERFGHFLRKCLTLQRVLPQ